MNDVRDQNSFSSSVRVQMRWWLALFAGIWWVTATILFLLATFGDTVTLKWYTSVYLLAVALASPICFVQYFVDKRRAKQDKWRVAEKSLQVSALLGGWPGGVIAQKMFHHKTRKKTFQVVFWGIVCVHIGLMWYAAFFLK